MENTATQSEPAPARLVNPPVNTPNIQWASAPGTVKRFELEEQFEVARSRNWISERLIEQSQKHWHCSREQAIERLLAQQH